MLTYIYTYPYTQKLTSTKNRQFLLEEKHQVIRTGKMQSTSMLKNYYFHLACSISNRNCYSIPAAGTQITCTEVKRISTDSEGFLNMPEARD